MIALNTDVLLRYLLQDDLQQSAHANGLIGSLGEASIYISTSVMLDLYTTLALDEKVSPDAPITVIEGLLRSREVVIQDAEVVHRAIRRMKATEGEFFDCLTVEQAESAGCSQVVSYLENDKVGMTVLVETPWSGPNKGQQRHTQ
jgi:predicted nucleic-acid-binding protein